MKVTSLLQLLASFKLAGAMPANGSRREMAAWLSRVSHNAKATVAYTHFELGRRRLEDDEELYRALAATKKRALEVLRAIETVKRGGNHRPPTGLRAKYDNLSYLIGRIFLLLDRSLALRVEAAL